tara:strand:+ start:26588 stop:27958 length:1371 start_codon:yes stop_codon:yes gene_type:complete
MLEEINVKFKQTKVAFKTLGCKLNFSETSQISRSLDNDVFKIVNFESSADVYVINTCSVTENAEKKLKTLVNKIKKINFESFVVVIGCYAQLNPLEISKIKNVDLILGISEKFNLNNYLLNYKASYGKKIHRCEINDSQLFFPTDSVEERTRAYVKIQDGCDYKCSFCTIPIARGRSRSDSIQSVLKRVNFILKKNIKEIVLTGINLGDFGKNFLKSEKNETLINLLHELDKIDSEVRFRLSSIEPNLLSDDIIEFISKSDKFCKHFHIPLQSGSNDILKKMKRRYLVELYSKRIKKIKTLIPNASIGVDVIVGFPGESEKNFNETYNFLKELEISYLHVFTYSERPNTSALDFSGIVPVENRKRRSNVLRSLSIRKKQFFYESQLGQIVDVLFENENKKGYITGYSNNYLRVKLPWNPYLINKKRKVELLRIDESGEFVGKITDYNFIPTGSSLL